MSRRERGGKGDKEERGGKRIKDSKEKRIMIYVTSRLCFQRGNVGNGIEFLHADLNATLHKNPGIIEMKSQIKLFAVLVAVI